MSHEANEKIALRVKKLLALATSSNEHESKIAMAKAMELCTTHNLSIQYVESVGEKETEDDKFVRHDVEVGRVPYEYKLVAPIIRDFFYVNPVLLNGKTFAFIGRESNVEIGMYVFEFLATKFLSLWLEYRTAMKKAGRNVSGGMKIEFMNGLQVGFMRKLRDSRAEFKQEQALTIIDEKLKAAVENEIGGVKLLGVSKFAGFAEARRSGEAKGREIQLNHGVKEGVANKALS